MKSLPPEKGGPCRQHGPIPNQNRTTRGNRNCSIARVQPFLAPATIWHRWEVEAGRLFAAFWRTAETRHLAAFSVHVRAMRALAGRRRS